MLWPRSTIFTSAGFDACALIAHVILLPARHAGCVVFSSSSPVAYITTGPSVHRTATSASIIMLLLFLFQCFRVDFFFRHGWRGRLSPKGDRHYQLTIESGVLLSSSCLTHARQIANQLLNRFVSLSKRPLQVNSRSDLVEKSERSSWDGIVSRKLSATQWKCRRNWLHNVGDFDFVGRVNFCEKHPWFGVKKRPLMQRRLCPFFDILQIFFFHSISTSFLFFHHDKCKSEISLIYAPLLGESNFATIGEEISFFRE